MLIQPNPVKIYKKIKIYFPGIFSEITNQLTPSTADHLSKDAKILGSLWHRQSQNTSSLFIHKF